MKKNRYAVVKLGINDYYIDTAQHRREFRSKPAAYNYANSMGYGYRVVKIGDFHKQTLEKGE